MTDRAAVEILNPGAYASIQDGGRRGLRRVGVPWSGVLHPARAALANALAGNPAAAPLIEHMDGGLRLRAVGGPLCLAVTGDAGLELVRRGEIVRGAAWRSYVLADGDELRVRTLAAGRLVYVAISGVQVASVLGSASTYARAGIGGALAAGDRLPASAAVSADTLLPRPPVPDAAPIRIVAGPQRHHFLDAALAALLGEPFTVSSEADRMGVRLRGPVLAHCSAAHREIVSDATVPGSIQVPGNGQPIVLLADAQTAGGYPKIATVISADLGRVADARPGSSLRFQRIDVAAAEALARAGAADLAALRASIRPLAGEGGCDLAALYAHNLVSGVVSGAEETE